MLFLFLLSTCLHTSPNQHHTFITIVDPLSKPSPFPSHHHWYSSLLSSSPSSIIHIYNTLLHGFSASLPPHQANLLQTSHGVVSIFPDSILHLHTTYSPSFLGLDNLPSNTVKTPDSDDTIIGIIDTGIWPEHPSFSDQHFKPVPTQWHGECESGSGFNKSNCNRKLIGARFFSGGYGATFGLSSTNEFLSPRDSDGHGTHVASIAAGALVSRSDFFGFAGGLSRGMAPRARIAVYKVCWDSGCLLSDVCAAFEKAVTDGVHIISISLGSSSRLPFYLDLFSIISFRAFSRGIFVSASAGNEGPTQASIANEPPWIMSVGSGTMDRNFPAIVRLGNGKLISGISITVQPGNRNKLTRNFHPLYLAGEIKSSISFNISGQLVNDKIVVCMTQRHVTRFVLGSALKYAGAIAMVISHGNIDPIGMISEPHEIPTITVGVLEAKLIEDYILGNENPVAMISSQGTIRMHAKPAPIVASFSSRGPNSMVPGILKPDIIAPGVNILGAWTDAIGPSGKQSDSRRSGFNIMSGTSMACPHVSGVAALIKTRHPNWGPSEIKSAMMTTSTIHKKYYNKNISNPGPWLISDENTGKVATHFDTGAGHVRPERALDPGLVFESNYQDYVNFMCQLNYTKEQMQIITGKPKICSKSRKLDLNYPGIVVEKERIELEKVILIGRRLKNVSVGGKEYKGKVMGAKGYYKVNLKPKRLKFSRIGETLNFTISIRKDENVKRRKKMWYGALIWREEGGKLKVRCPIVVFGSTKGYSN